MARILYGIMGNTYGHVMRSLALARRLPEHEFYFIGGGRVPEVVGNEYPCLDVPVLRTVHGEKSVSVGGVVSQALQRVTELPKVVRSISTLCDRWQPDHVIVDREFFLPLACRWMKRSCLALNHSGLLLSTRYPVASSQKMSWSLAMLNDHLLYDFTDRNWSVSFYHPPLRNRKKDRLFPPVVRPEVIERSGREGGHVLVYLTSARFQGLLPALQALKRPVLVYGSGHVAGRSGNVEFRPYDSSRILDDLAGCAYAVVNGGHNLISEALYFGKPVLCFPFGLLFEQYLNAHYVRELNYGDFCEDMSDVAGAFEKMEQGLERYRQSIAAGFREGTAEVVAALRQELV